MTFRVIWQTDIEAQNAFLAAEAVLEAQRPCDVSVFNFEVFEILPDGRSGPVQAVRPSKENPLNRPESVICGDSVCCGHCGSANTRYVEDVGQSAPLWARFGVAFVRGDDLEADEDGDDPRAWCLDCNRESQLPRLFQWA